MDNNKKSLETKYQRAIRKLPLSLRKHFPDPLTWALRREFPPAVEQFHGPDSYIHPSPAFLLGYFSLILAATTTPINLRDTAPFNTPDHKSPPQCPSKDQATTFKKALKVLNN